MDTAQVVARFEAERQALALMDHPNIARVFDAGATDTGRPFFVMELVKGVPITEYCDEARLSPRQRLELFIPVCQAIQHAHQKGIIHRDIKPSNVLVTLVDGQPVPKVIDFGIAKAIDQRLTEKSLFTQFGAIVGTLEYMSPEQADFSAPGRRHPERRLFAGRAAVRAADRHHAAGARAAARGGLRRDPPADPGGGAAEAEHAAVGVGRPPGVDRGGAERRAGAADPAGAGRPGLDRDEGAGEGPDAAIRDGQRVRPGRPAVPRRRRGGGVPAVGGVPAPQVRRQAPRGAGHRGGLRGPADRRGGDQPGDGRGGATRAEQATGLERDRAVAAEGEAKAEGEKSRRSAQESRAVLQFFQEQVLAAARPEGQAGGLGREVTIRKAVDAAEPRIAGAFQDQPTIEASVRNALGQTYLYLGESGDGDSRAGTCRGALRVSTRARPPRLAQQPQQPRRGLPGRRPHRRGHRDDQATLKAQEAKLGPDHPDTLNSRNNLAAAYWSAGRTAEAIAMHEATLKAQETKLGPDHPDTLTSRNNLAEAYHAAGRTTEAIPLLEATLKAQETKLGPDHPDTLTSRNNLAVPTRPPAGRRGHRAARGDAQGAGGEARPRPPRHAHQP